MVLKGGSGAPELTDPQGAQVLLVCHHKLFLIESVETLTTVMESLGCTDYTIELLFYIAGFKPCGFYNIRRQAKSKHQKQGYGTISEISDKDTEIQEN